MLLLAKLVPAGYTSHAKLRTLTQVDLVRIGVEDEESRKGMMRFLGKRESAKGKGKAKAVETAAKKEEEGEFSAGVKRKRPGRESDLDKPLPSREVNRAAVDEDFDFEEITYEEVRPFTAFPPQPFIDKRKRAGTPQKNGHHQPRTRYDGVVVRCVGASRV